MKFNAIILLTFALIAGCKNDATSISVNYVEKVESTQITHDGVPWIEVTIHQRTNPQSPTYITGIREAKWANELRWSLVSQNKSEDMVVTGFRIRTTDTKDKITLTADDFEWYPPRQGFEPIDIVLRERKDDAKKSNQE